MKVTIYFENKIVYIRMEKLHYFHREIQCSRRYIISIIITGSKYENISFVVPPKFYLVRSIPVTPILYLKPTYAEDLLHKFEYIKFHRQLFKN
jgi:hypothetical protein